jgi:molecular chaperone GrpE
MSNGTETTGAAESETEGGPLESGRDSAAELKAALADRDHFKEKWLRSEADLDNHRRRARQEREEDAKFRSLHLAKDLLPAIDNLHRTLEAAEKGADIAKLVEGVKLVAKQFDDVLARHSVLPMGPVGKPFDPNLHQAIQQVPSAEHPPMTVITEYERGYTMHDRVVRPSSVVVSAAPAS